MRRRFASLGLLAALALCAGAAAGARSGAPACPPLPGAGVAPRSAPAPSRGVMLLTGLTVKTDRCGDRIVFRFRARLTPSVPPGFRASYAPRGETLVEDPSGRPVRVAGSAFLVVRFEPASTVDLTGGRPVVSYDGPSRLRPAGARFARELVKTGDFEAVLTWVVGLAGKRPFRATASASPPTLVLELR